MDVTPDGILTNRFCDVRFGASLAHPRVKCYECPHQEWLLMHHRVRWYDRSQRCNELDLETYTNAMLKVEVSDDDRQLEEETGLNAAKIAFIRRDFEEKAIQGVYRDEENVRWLRSLRALQVNKRYGDDFGTKIWNQVVMSLESCFTEEQIEKNRDWWRECKIPPPPEEDEEVHGDDSKYW